MCLFFRFCKPRSKTNVDVFSVISSKNHNLKVFPHIFVWGSYFWGCPAFSFFSSSSSSSLLLLPSSSSIITHITHLHTSSSCTTSGTTSRITHALHHAHMRHTSPSRTSLHHTQGGTTSRITHALHHAHYAPHAPHITITHYIIRRVHRRYLEALESCRARARGAGNAGRRDTCVVCAGRRGT